MSAHPEFSVMDPWAAWPSSLRPFGSRSHGDDVQVALSALLADAEAGKDPVQHRFGELFARDFTEAVDRLTQINRPEIPRQTIGRHLLTALQGVGSRGRQITLALIERHQQGAIRERTAALQQALHQLCLANTGGRTEAHIGMPIVCGH